MFLRRCCAARWIRSIAAIASALRKPRALHNVLDSLDTAIKEYLTSLDTDALDDSDHRRLSEILAFTTNLEHAGDIVERSLMPLGAKRIKRGVSFSEASRCVFRSNVITDSGGSEPARDPAT